MLPLRTCLALQILISEHGILPLLLISVCREKQKLLVAFVCCLEVSETLLLQQEVGYLQDGYTLLQRCSASLVLDS